MSEKAIKLTQNKSFTKIIWWGTGIIALIIAEVIAVLAAMHFTESKNKSNTEKLYSLENNLALQQNEIHKLAQLSTDIAENRAKIEENSGNIQLYSLNFKELKNEVGNNKIIILGKQVEDISHRLESVEETKNQEALILSLALIIKENVLYDKPIDHEIDILQNMVQTQENIKSELETLAKLKNLRLKNEYQLVDEFNLFAADFNFEKPEEVIVQNDSESEKSTVEKSIEIIKDTVAGINFDKVIKKDKKTSEEKRLLKNLKDLVNLHKFTEALTYIHDNPKFAEAHNESLNNWIADVQNKLSFDKAISVIITSELSALREDFKETSAPVNADN